MADINVTMTVDTAKLKAGASGASVAKCCTLTDNNGDPSGSTGFDIQCDTGQTVQFAIASIEKNVDISFSYFDYEAGTNGVFFPMPAKENDWTGIVAGVKGQKESYYIHFVVPSIQADAFRLDPEVDVKGP